jgi:hypothetical protein
MGRRLAIASALAVASIAALAPACAATAAQTPPARQAPRASSPAARLTPPAKPAAAKPVATKSAAARAAPKPAAATPTQPPPNFGGLWVRDDPDNRFMPPETGPGPMLDDPKHPHQGNVEGTNIGSTPHVADITNPVLKPWAAAVLDRNGKIGLLGKDVYTNYALCLPSGVPLVAAPRARMQLLQPKGRDVAILYEYDSQSRHIRMSDAHAAKIAPSWYGESIGHYEGDTLVIDTVGQNQRTAIDRYGTPHTGALHVVERYRLIDGGARLEDTFSVEDAKTFTMPWTAVVHWKRSSTSWEENVCAENPRMEDGRMMAPVAERSPF